MAENMLVDDMFLATQPILPMLLKGVVAYVEVRSGHDNRSMGVQSELRTLGALVELTLNDKVTHVVFQGGLVSTYRKARKYMCHVVSVSWIEASKSLGHVAPEEEYPPPGMEKYEDPDAARKIKVLKSMQPDFDEEKGRERLNTILSKIKRRKVDRPDTEDDASSVEGKCVGRQRRQRSHQKKNDSLRSQSTEYTISSTTRYSKGNMSDLLPQRSERKGSYTSRKAIDNNYCEISSKSAKEVAHLSSSLKSSVKAASDLSEKDITERNVSQSSDGTGASGTFHGFGPCRQPGIDIAQVDSSLLGKNISENRPSKSNLSLPRASANKNTAQRRNRAVATVVDPRRRTDGSSAAAHSNDPQHCSSLSSSSAGIGSKTVTNAEPEPETPNEIRINDKNTRPNGACDPHSTGKTEPTQPRALASIENTLNERWKKSDKFNSEDTSLAHPSEQTPVKRMTRKSYAELNQVEAESVADSLPRRMCGANERETPARTKKFKLALTEGNPFVSCVLMTLSTKKPEKLYQKSPWRRALLEKVERRQSPRLNPLKKRTQVKVGLRSNRDNSEEEDSDESLRVRPDSPVPRKKRIVPLKRTGPTDRASAHAFRLWKAKACHSESPLNDTIIEDHNKATTCNINPVDPANRTDKITSHQLSTSENILEHSAPVTHSQIGLACTLSGTCNDEIPELERSQSPVLGTSVKHGMLRKSLLKSNTSMVSLPNVSSVEAKKKVRKEQPFSNGAVGTAVDAKGRSPQPQKENAPKFPFYAQDDDNLSTEGTVGSCETVEAESGKERPISSGVVSIAVDTERRAPLQQKRKVQKFPFDAQEDDNLSTEGTVGSCETVETETDKRNSSSSRPRRRRSRPDNSDKRSYIVCTHMKSMYGDVEKVEKAVDVLGSFVMEDQVSSRTTHLVASGPIRTVNMLRAVSRGCWVLTADWVFRSVKAGKWLDESDFELSDFSPLVKQRRMHRQSCGEVAQWDLFSSVGSIFVSPACQPPASDLKELIVLNSGSVTKSIKDADLVVGPSVKKSSKETRTIPRVLPVWVLDCITKGQLVPTSTLCYRA